MAGWAAEQILPLEETGANSATFKGDKTEIDPMLIPFNSLNNDMTHKSAWFGWSGALGITEGAISRPMLDDIKSSIGISMAFRGQNLNDKIPKHAESRIYSHSVQYNKISIYSGHRLTYRKNTIKYINLYFTVSKMMNEST